MTEREAPADPTVERVLRTVETLAHELHPRRAADPVTLETRFDRDLGLDSLARVELMLRVQRETGRSLPEDLVSGAETPRDLLDALIVPQAERARRAEAASPAAVVAGAEPLHATTLLDVLEWQARLRPQQVHVVLERERGAGLEARSITHAELLEGATAVAGGLQAQGLQPGETVAIMLPTGRDYFLAFFGIMLAGAVPVPMYPPLRAAQLADHLRRLAGILSSCRARMLVTGHDAKPAARLLQAHAPALRAVLTADELQQGAGRLERARVGSDDLAFLQYTSGSTGDPKGVMLTHANLLANLRAMGRAVQASSADVFVSWLPLYHDMGLIGAWFGSLYYGVRLVAMSPPAFLARPARWLWALHRHRGTLSAAPNFAYELCVHKIEEAELEGLDLSSWRLAFNGAEPVSAETIDAFTCRFARYGFAAAAMTPVYGLAECCVGLAFPPLRRGPLVDSIDRELMTRDGRALPVAPDDPRAWRVVACGQAMPEHALRVVDEMGHEAGDRTEGHVQFQGPSATRGYYRHPEATRALLRDGWLDTGDLGYMVGDEVYLTGRAKDIVIRAGRHLHPEEIERAVGAVDGVRRGCVAAFGSRDPRHGTERLVVLAETRERDAQALEWLRTRVNLAVTAIAGDPPDQVVLAPPHSVPRTSSGKLRRLASRELFEHGRIGSAPRALAWQALGFAWLGTLRRLREASAATLYAAYAWSVFWTVAVSTLVGVVVLPGVSRRRRLAQAAVRLIAWFTRVQVRVEGARHVHATRACVLVSNHASYADALVLLAALPAGMPYAFLVKRELAGNWAARTVLERTGMLLVERVDVQRSVQDARAAVRRLQDGDTLLVFAEGTLRRAAGLMPFHLGGFAAAVRAGAPVLPAAIRGTRTLLRDGQWFPRRVPVSVTFGAPIPPPATLDEFAATLALRDAARAFVLQHCGEPDLEG